MLDLTWETLVFISGNGCGHTVLGTESGTLASQSYPGTYPSNTWCKWRLRVPEGRTLRLLFGDFDIESSPDCSNGSLVITYKNGDTSLGKIVRRCWNTVCLLNASQVDVWSLCLGHYRSALMSPESVLLWNTCFLCSVSLLTFSQSWLWNSHRTCLSFDTSAEEGNPISQQTHLPNRCIKSCLEGINNDNTPN